MRLWGPARPQPANKCELRSPGRHRAPTTWRRYDREPVTSIVSDRPIGLKWRGAAPHRGRGAWRPASSCVDSGYAAFRNVGAVGRLDIGVTAGPFGPT